MSESVYAVVAYVARYWFAFLAVVIVWRAVKWLRKDASRTSRAQRRLPDAGFIGEWAVVASEAPDVRVGQVLRAPREGWFGSARAADVQVRDVDVPARAARFFLKEDGLHVQPVHDGILRVDGEPVQREAVMRHGATITMGDVTLQLRLFAGVLLTGETPVSQTVDRRGRLVPMEIVPDEGMDDPYEEDDALYGEDAFDNGDYYTDSAALAPADDGRVALPKPTLTTTKRLKRRQ